MGLTTIPGLAQGACDGVNSRLYAVSRWPSREGARRRSVGCLDMASSTIEAAGDCSIRN